MLPPHSSSMSKTLSFFSSPLICFFFSTGIGLGSGFLILLGLEGFSFQILLGLKGLIILSPPLNFIVRYLICLSFSLHH